MWNCIAEAGKKVLVWTWPGASWPPSSNSENLHVVGGMAPMGPNMVGCDIDKECITFASVNIGEISMRGKTELHGGAGCVMEGKIEEEEENDGAASFFSEDTKAWPLLDHSEGEESGEFPNVITTFDVPLRAPKN